MVHRVYPLISELQGDRYHRNPMECCGVHAGMVTEVAEVPREWNKIVWDFISNVALSLILSFYDALAVAKTFSNC